MRRRELVMFGKEYVWTREGGKLTLRSWPLRVGPLYLTPLIYEALESLRRARDI